MQFVVPMQNLRLSWVSFELTSSPSSRDKTSLASIHPLRQPASDLSMNIVP